MMKRFLAIFLLTCLFLTSCGEEVSTATEGEGTETEEYKEKYPYDLTQYVTMGLPEEISASFGDPDVCTDEELEAAVFQVLLSNASFKEKAGAAEQYNKVQFDFSLTYEGTVQEEYTQSGFYLILGNPANPELETLLSEALIGTVVGDERSVNYTYPDSVTSGTWRGKTVVATAKVTRVYQHTLPECDDEFAKSLSGFSFQSAQEFRQSLREDILYRKEEEMVAAFWLEFVKTVTVLKYPSVELELYQNDFRLYHEQMAEKLGMQFDSYLKAYLETDEKGFEKEVKAYGEELCRNEMVFTQLTRKLKITLSEEEYQSCLLREFQESDGSFSSVKAYEAYYGKNNLQQNFIWNKTMVAAARLAERLEPEA